MVGSCWNRIISPSFNTARYMYVGFFFFLPIFHLCVYVFFFSFSPFKDPYMLEGKEKEKFFKDAMVGKDLWEGNMDYMRTDREHTS